MKHAMAVLAAFAVAFGGCATTHPDSSGTENAYFEDLPAAPGLTPDKDPVTKNYGHKTPSGKLREYRQHYSGERSLETTKKWYEDTFPVHGWSNLTSEGTDPATVTFEKGAEKVTISLKTEGGKLKVMVHVTGK